jgi:hypothetical protein
MTQFETAVPLSHLIAGLEDLAYTLPLAEEAHQNAVQMRDSWASRAEEAAEKVQAVQQAQHKLAAIHEQVMGLLNAPVAVPVLPAQTELAAIEEMAAEAAALLNAAEAAATEHAAPVVQAAASPAPAPDPESAASLNDLADTAAFEWFCAQPAGRYTGKAVAESRGIPQATQMLPLHRLVDQGLLRREGRGQRGDPMLFSLTAWSEAAMEAAMVRELPLPADPADDADAEAPADSSAAPLADLPDAEWIYTILQAQPHTTRKELQAATSLSNTRLARALNELLDARRIEGSGEYPTFYAVAGVRAKVAALDARNAADLAAVQEVKSDRDLPPFRQVTGFSAALKSQALKVMQESGRAVSETMIRNRMGDGTRLTDLQAALAELATDGLVQHTDDGKWQAA